MSSLSERLLSHAVNDRVVTLRESLASLESDRREQANAADIGWVLDRVPAMLDRVEATVHTTAPELVVIAPLDQVAASLAQVETELANYRSNGDLGHLNNLNSYLDQAALQLVQLPGIVLADPDLSRVISERIGEALGARIQELGDRADSLSVRIDGEEQDQADALAASKTAIDQTTAALDQRLTDLAAQVAAEKQRADALIADETRRLEELRTQQTAQYETARSAAEKASADALKTFASETDTLTIAFRDETEQARTDAAEQLEAARALYRAAADTNTSGAFATEANEQKRAAFWWSIGTVALVLLTAALAVVLHHGASNDPSLAEVIGRVVLTLPGFGVAAWAGAQAGHHRQREQTARRLQLEIAALGPFVEELGGTEAQAVRMGVADRIFRGQPVSAGGPGGKAADGATTSPAPFSQVLEIARRLSSSSESQS